MMHLVALAKPLSKRSGTREAVRLTAANLREVTGLGGEKWAPALTEPPAITMRLWQDGFDAAVRTGRAALPINLAQARKHYPNIDHLFWPGAEVEMFVGRKGQAWPWRQIFSGRVTSHTAKEGKFTLVCEINSEPFRKDLLTTYAGNGGIEGGTDIKTRAKPLIIGLAKSVGPVPIDNVNLVYQFSAYGAVESIALYERGEAYPAPIADYADYDALVAATIPHGAYATCLAQGLVRLGAPFYGVLTGDVLGHMVNGATPRRAGDIIAAMAQIAGVPSSLLAKKNLSAMDAARDVDQGLAITTQSTFFDQAVRLALPCNYQAGISLLGQFFVTRPNLDRSPSLTLHAQGRRRPQVIETEVLSVGAPYAQIRLGADQAYRVHTLDEISAGGHQVRGIFEADAYYRANDLVFADDGRAFVYINAVPGSGNAPPTASATSNSHWKLEGIADQTEANQVFLDAIAPIGSATIGESARIIIRRGGVDVSADASFAAGPFPSGLDADFGTGADLNLLTLTQADNAGNIPVTVTYAGRDYQTVVPVAQNGEAGADGVSRFVIRLYRRNAVLPPTPDSPVTFTVATDHLAGVTNSWQREPQASDGNPQYYTEATFTIAATATTHVIQPSDWISARIDVRDGVDGADGLNGTDGLPGSNGSDGQTSYVHFAYADSADGTVNFTNGAPGSRTYIGVYTDFTLADSTDPADYTWSLIKGADGTNGTPGANGADGQSSYVHIAYANSSNGTADFDLADPTGRDYIGVYTDSVLADSTDPADYTWSLIKGADGTDGADGAQGPQGPPRSAGAYSAAVFYEQDDLVFAPDGRAFLYINASSTAGQPLPVLPDTVNSYWREISTADNTASNQITIDEIPPILVTADSSGVTTTDLSAVPRRVTIRQGDFDVSANATFSAGAAPGGLAGDFGTGSDANLFTPTQADASGSFPVTVTYGGTTYLAFIKVERTRAAPTQGGGAGNTDQVNDQSWPAVSSASHVQVTDDPMIIQSDANGHLEWGYYAVCDGVDGMRVAGLAQYSTDNATWTDADTEALSSPVQTIQGTFVSGYLADGGTVTSLTPNTDYYVRLTVRVVTGGSATFRDEQFTFEQP